MLTQLIYYLPKNLLSRIAGWLAERKFPSFMLKTFIKWYVGQYKVEMNDAEKGIDEFTTFNEFFTRALKPGKRPIDQSEQSVVSPVDGVLLSMNEIENGSLLQVKNIHYLLSDLIGEKKSPLYEGGVQLTIYLSPSDYHRIHVPIDSKLETYSYFSGNLWPVNNIFANRLGGLFSLNERIYSHFQAENSFYGMVKVGAMIVGKIAVKYTDVTTNNKFMSVTDQPPNEPFSLTKGGEVGHFCLGSTVILLFPKGFVNISDSLKLGQKLQMGEVIGSINDVG